MFPIRQKIAAGGAALACRDQLLVRPVGIHDEDLVALVALPRGLEDETLSVRRPIRLRILASLGKLADIAKMRGVSRKEKGTQPKHRDQFHLFFNYTEA